MATKDSKPMEVVYRNAKTGEFTTPQYAKKHPATTEREVRPKPSK